MIQRPDSPTTCRATSRGAAPSAMRTPISRRRCATRYDATLYSPLAASSSAIAANAVSNQARKRGRAVSRVSSWLAGLDGHELLRIEVGGDLPEVGGRIDRTGRRAKREAADEGAPGVPLDHHVGFRARLVSEALSVSNVREHADDRVPGALDWLALRKAKYRGPNAPPERSLSREQQPFRRLVQYDDRLAERVGSPGRPCRESAESRTSRNAAALPTGDQSLAAARQERLAGPRCRRSLAQVVAGAAANHSTPPTPRLVLTARARATPGRTRLLAHSSGIWRG